MPSFYIGIDLHYNVIQVCVLDPKGDPIEERRFRFDGLEEGLRVVGFLESFGSEIRVAVEALGLNRWFVNACKERSIDVLVCGPRKLDLKKLGKKTDRRDARENAPRARSLGGSSSATWTGLPPPTIQQTKSMPPESFCA